MERLRDERGLTFVHPFDDPEVIAGHGSIGLEILEDLPDVDVVVGSVGGGGLLAGVASAMRAVRPDVQVFAAEPETAAPLDISLRNGYASRFDGWRPSFVDGAGGKSVLPTMWPLLSRLVAGSIVMPLDDIARAMALVAERCRVITEGAAACAVAAALSGRVRGRIVAIVSGGNIDLSTFASLVGACGDRSSTQDQRGSSETDSMSGSLSRPAGDSICLPARRAGGPS
jgi:threonine dehydratase